MNFLLPGVLKHFFNMFFSQAFCLFAGFFQLFKVLRQVPYQLSVIDGNRNLSGLIFLFCVLFVSLSSLF